MFQTQNRPSDEETTLAFRRNQAALENNRFSGMKYLVSQGISKPASYTSSKSHLSVM